MSPWPSNAAPHGSDTARGLALSIGREVMLARTNLALTRRHAAKLAGVSPSTQERVERGDPSVGIATACRVAAGVGLRVWAKAFPVRTPSLRDTGQLRIAEVLRRAAHVAFRVAIELPMSEGRSAHEVCPRCGRDHSRRDRATPGRLAGTIPTGVGEARRAGGSSSAAGSARPGRRGYAVEPDSDPTPRGVDSQLTSGGFARGDAGPARRPAAWAGRDPVDSSAQRPIHWPLVDPTANSGGVWPKTGHR